MPVDRNQVLIKALDRRHVFVKSSKGLQEIQTKAFQLPARLRRLLIMVDGRSSLGELMERYASLSDDLEAQFLTLVAEGFLVPRRSGQVEIDREEEMRRVDPRDFNLDKAKGFARFVVLGVLGPAGSRRAERIDGCQSALELCRELEDLRDALPKILPARQGKHVMDQIEPLMRSLGRCRSASNDAVPER